MLVVAGLGNPGERYLRTRHNAGFRAIDVLAGRAGAQSTGRSAAASLAGADAWVLETRLARSVAPCEPAPVEAPPGVATLLVRPLSFMNRSGEPIARILAATHGRPSDLVVILDDVALPLGRIRVREKGSDGGHNGLRSIIEAIGSQEFARIRIGVGGGAPAPEDLAEYVLSEPPAEEQQAFEEAVVRAADAVEVLAGEGAAAAMNRFNASRP